MQLMYDSSPVSTVAAYVLLATARRLIGAGKTTDWKGKFQDPASCVALWCKQLAQRVCTNLQLENVYEHWQTLFLQALFGKAPVTKGQVFSIPSPTALCPVLGTSSSLCWGMETTESLRREDISPTTNPTCNPALFTSFSGCVIQTSKIYKYFMAFRKCGMFLVSFTRAQLLRGIECMYPLRNPATSAVLRSAIKQQPGEQIVIHSYI